LTKFGKTGTLLEDLYTFMIYRWILLSKRNISDKICRENQKTFYVRSHFPKICRFSVYVEISCRDLQATSDNKAHANSMLNT
jgi:hypothetical protein